MTLEISGKNYNLNVDTTSKVTGDSSPWKKKYAAMDSIMSNPIKANNEDYYAAKLKEYEEARFKYEECLNRLRSKKELTAGDKSELDKLRFDMDFKFSLKTDAGLRLLG